MSTMVGEICPISFGCGEKVAMLGGVVKGSYGGGKIVLSCICFVVGVCKGLRRVRPVRLGSQRPCSMS
jgi:hypothetical protein